MHNIQAKNEATLIDTYTFEMTTVKVIDLQEAILIAFLYAFEMGNTTQCHYNHNSTILEINPLSHIQN